MDYGGSRSRSPVDVVSDSTDKLDEGLRGLWDTVVWPHRVVKLTNQAAEAELLLLQRTVTLNFLFLKNKMKSVRAAFQTGSVTKMTAVGETYAVDVKLSDRPLGQNRFGQHLDDQVSVVQRILIERPVVITFHLDGGRGGKPHCFRLMSL